MHKFIFWIKNEKILLISALFALLTMFLVPPDSLYIEYINLRVLCLLFCLMAVIEGFQQCHAFRCLTAVLLVHNKNGKVLDIILILLPFFSAMLVTNDVALLTFVPFTMLLLQQIKCEKAIVPTLVLQTIAANLGSMATPIGNPQNLYLYETYTLSVRDFFTTMLPLTLVSLIGLIIASIPLLPKELPTIKLEAQIISRHKLFIYIALFFLCLLTVFRILPYEIVTIIIIITLLFTNRNILKKLDYALLITFVFFFIISGNLGRVEAVQIYLASFMEKYPLLTPIFASQIISNVPAAVLLSTFTDNWVPLLKGVNIGGLGTAIASLASLITLKIYIASPQANIKRFLGIFTIANIIAILILLSFSCSLPQFF